MSGRLAGAVLVLNCGSSSLKYRLFDGADTLAHGLVERIGEPGGDAADHGAALGSVLSTLDLTGLAAVGHRVVHGGPDFSAPAVVDDAVVDAVRRLIPLAPLHNPANLAGIEVARRLLPNVPQVAVFDTAFHATMPEATATYAIDVEVARRLRVRKYGFHGTSHAYVSRCAATLLGRPPAEVNVITLHLGNGASACAVHGGRSIATTMGMTPLPGLVMGTRSGDIDPAVVFHLHRVGGMSIDEIDNLLNRDGGLRGLAGENDMRAVLRRRSEGDAAATLAFDVYCTRIKQYVGAYLALLGRLDAIAFTAGVGENAPVVRAAALAGLAGLGIAVDPDRNARAEPVISPPGSPVTVCVIPTDEEFEIAEQTRHALA
ncbi:acetate/propionate family kinase [Rhizomonospora bruguierae]|uniref:acetate/propionate family kinase n=1 Tax=Rhizomonospora bruguierae TaxID=1581705 RepID=UPI001BD06801|nr:acetate kinase [Micromonospora sp. NBRC 107566]